MKMLARKLRNVTVANAARGKGNKVRCCKIACCK